MEEESRHFNPSRLESTEASGNFLLLKYLDSEMEGGAQEPEQVLVERILLESRRTFRIPHPLPEASGHHSKGGDAAANTPRLWGSHMWFPLSSVESPLFWLLVLCHGVRMACRTSLGISRGSRQPRPLFWMAFPQNSHHHQTEAQQSTVPPVPYPRLTRAPSSLP